MTSTGSMIEAVPTAGSNIIIQRSQLLQLPKELLLTIWEFTLAETNPITFLETHTFDKDEPTINNVRTTSRWRWYTPPLLQVCRTCRVEGSPVFYGNNTFVLRHEPVLDDYQQAYTLFKKHWQHLMRVTDFGIEYQLPSSNVFILRGQREKDCDGYRFRFTSDAAPSHQRPLTALEASETDNCLCMIDSVIDKRQYPTLMDYTEAMIAFLASFSEKMSKNELRVLRPCGQCGKRMVEQKPRQPAWLEVLPASIPMQDSAESDMNI
jgi:hypothetical protein